jgi:ribosomal protein S18 acetylase RimI-like enzyme
MNAPLAIREIDAEGFAAAWPVFHEVIAAGDTYSYAPDMTMQQAQAMWTTPPSRCFVATRGSEVLGLYMLRPNQPGLGDHVANAGYMVATRARGQGIASAMCEHSLAEARRAGFAAMQFNYVVASNEGAVRLWQRHGFAIVGHVPAAFRHARLGAVGVHVMHRAL